MSWLKTFNHYINKQVYTFGAEFFVFGLLSLSFGLLSGIATYVDVRAGHPILYIPLVITGIYFVFFRYWPKSIKSLFTPIWYIALFYNIAFLLSLETLTNHTSISQGFIIPALFCVLIFLTDLLSAFVLIFTGLTCALLCYIFIMGKTLPAWDLIDIYMQYLLITLVLTYFKLRQSVKKANYDKNTVAQDISATIAHEIRTPLGTIRAGSQGVQQFLGDLIKTYYIAKDKNLDIPHIRSVHLDQLDKSLKIINDETSQINTIVDMLLTQARFINHKKIIQTECQIKQTINRAIERYPFTPNERSLIHLNIQHNFSYLGDESLMIYVIYNLLRNAIYAIHEKERGEILISTHQDNKYNYLHFRDTAIGISKQTIKKIFQQYYSNKPNGVGIGLAFCQNVIQSFHGNITCHSILGEYTEFVIKLPIIKN